MRGEIQYAVLDAHQFPLGAGHLGMIELSLGNGVEGDLIKDPEQAMLPGVADSGIGRSGSVPDVIDGPSYELVPAWRFGRVNLDT